MLIILGGVKTEPQYFGFLNKRLGAALDIRIEAAGKDAGTLLNTAVRIRNEERRNAKANRDPHNSFNEVWVVVDVDDSANQLRGVLADAAQEEIRFAVSNPCFEVWLLLHSRFSTAPMDQSEAQDAALKCGLVGAGDRKTITPSEIVGKFKDARVNAQRLRKHHSDNGTIFPHDTPSTSVDLLVDYLVESSLASSANQGPSGSTVLLPI